MSGAPATVATVKQVLSGDTLLLQSSSGNVEKAFGLAYVDAPRLKREGDEAHAFKSREFLIKHLCLQKVSFKVLYTTPGGREYGIVQSEDGCKYPHENLIEGWVTVRDNAGGRDGSEEAALVNEFKALQTMAQNERVGMFSGEDGRIECVNDPNPAQFMEEFKGKAIQSQVEKVLTGDRLIIRMWVSDKKHYEVLVLLAGVQAPKTERKNQDTQQVLPAEPYANEAQEFVEYRLLQRRVTVKVVGLSPQNHLIAIVEHPMHDIGQLLVGAGLADPFDMHSTLVGAPYMAKVRQNQAWAKENHKGKYKNYVAPKQNDSAAIPVTVVRILSADTVFVRSNTVSEKRIALSSIVSKARSRSCHGSVATNLILSAGQGRTSLLKHHSRKPPKSSFAKSSSESKSA